MLLKLFLWDEFSAQTTGKILALFPGFLLFCVKVRGRESLGKLNSQFIVTARIDLSIFAKNFKFQSLLLLSLQ